MPTITSTGIGSGLDIESLITKLVSLERTPITQLTTQTSKLQTQLSSYGKVQAALATLRDAASKLTRPDTWAATVASSSDAASVSVTAASTDGTIAAPGSVSVQVAKLASAQTLASKVLPASPASVGQGSITIELGQWNADQSAFTAKDGVTAITVDIGAGEDQLSQIRDKINAARPGIGATVVTDSNGSRLVLRGNETGAANGFRVTVNDADGNNTDDAGLSALAFDPTAGVNAANQKLGASNAAATINGIDISSASNNLTGVVAGLNINLVKTTVGDITLNVASDTTSIKKAITDMATAYNSMATLLRDQTKAVPLARGSTDSSQSGPLQGDTTVISLQAQLRNLVGSSSTLGGSLARLTDIGLEPSAAGTLTTNDTKLTAALGNLDNMKQLFMGLDTGNPDNNGIAQRLRSLGDIALGTDGRLSSRQTGLQSRISDNGKRNGELEARVALTETRLRARYTALDTQMAKLTSLSNYVTQQFGTNNNR